AHGGIADVILYHVAAAAFSNRACLKMLQAPLKNSAHMIRPTAKSGHGESVAAVTAAAAMTSMLPNASLREQSHTERRLASLSRKRSKSTTAPRLTASASAPISPIGSACGA